MAAAMRTRSVERPRFEGLGRTRWRHPNEAVHNRLVYRLMEEVLAYAAARYARGRLLDVGCGSKPWQGLFAPYVDEHLGVDRTRSPHDPVAVDIVATAYEIPLEGSSVDTIVMNAVLEHLEEPQRALAECRRLLRPGGHLIITAPFVWPVHAAPHDFFRYSPYGLRHLLAAAGFEIVEVEPVAGAWKTFSIQISYALRRYDRGPLAPLVHGLMRFLQWGGARWDLVDYQPRFSWSHLAVARVPDEGGADAAT
jgi:SAM-dependent methyltransferase